MSDGGEKTCFHEKCLDEQRKHKARNGAPFTCPLCNAPIKYHGKIDWKELCYKLMPQKDTLMKFGLPALAIGPMVICAATLGFEETNQMHTSLMDFFKMILN